MEYIALAILIVGLCFYNMIGVINGLQSDDVAMWFAIIATLMLFILIVKK